MKYVQEQLITVDGPPGLSSYGLLQCGNQENSTGSAQERADAHSWLDDTLSDLADLRNWFAEHLWLILAALAILGLLAGILAALAPVLAGIGALGAIIGAAVLFLRFPETENHRFMIKSSRYLNNQIIISDLDKSGGDASRFRGYQQQLKDLFLAQFQDILKNDFEEYNSRPYTEYSLNAVLNLAQFAQDEDVRLAARMSLDYVAAKFAAGSNQGRRLVSFRRRMDAIVLKSEAGLFDVLFRGDHVTAYMFFHHGQTQQMWDDLFNELTKKDAARQPQRNLLPRDLVAQMVRIASASINPEDAPSPDDLSGLPVPPEITLSIAIDKSMTYEQRIKIKAAGIEIYSSGPGWLISAGGIEAPAKNVAFLDAGGLPIPLSPLSSRDDSGAAWPTVMLMTGATSKVHIRDLFRVEGLLIHYYDSKTPTSADDPSLQTYQGNACVGVGFACGYNVKLPLHFDRSSNDPGLCTDSLVDNGNWTFIDTSKCIWYNDANRNAASPAFVALYRQPCGAGMKCDNFGLFEVIDASDPAFALVNDDRKFSTFQTRVLSNGFNLATVSGSFLGIGGTVATGTYKTVKLGSNGIPHTIAFQGVFSNSADKSMSVITSIDGANRAADSDWNLAEGDLIRADRSGRVEIGRSGGTLLILDMTDKDHPKREIK